MSYENTVIKERLKNLRAKMQEYGIDYYMMPTSDFHNSEYSADFFKVREYFCGFDGSNGTLVVSQDHAGMWTDGRYFIQAENQMKGTGVELFKMMNPGVPTIEEFLFDNMKEGQTLGFDGRVVSTSIGERLEKKLSDKKVNFRIDKDLAEEVWTERPALPCHDMYVLSDELCGRSFKEKLSDVRAKMEKAGAKAHLLSKLDDIMWLTNLRGNDVECNPVALSYAYITMDEFILFVQEKEVTEEVRKYCDKVGIVLKDYHEIMSFISSVKFEGDILYDKRNTNFLTFKTLSDKTKADNVQMKNEKDPTELMKAVKNETELKNIREVYLRDSAALTEFIYWVKKNVGKMPMTEYTAAMKLDSMRAELPGFIELSFPTISAYNANAAMAHYEASENNAAEVKAQGMLLVDSGGTYMGGTTDVTRTIVVGEISDEIKKHYTATVAGMLQMADALFLEGCTGRNLDVYARRPLWDIGIDYNHGTGHGIGYMLNVHEGPHSLRWRYAEGVSEALLEPGMIVSDEPGVYIEGSHGIRIENIIEVVERSENEYGKFLGFEHLTYAPIDLEAIDTRYMKPEHVELLNKYHKAVYDKVSPLIKDEEVLAWLKEATREI
ncbi:aminopeptidase P family protein [Butyrivibrio sp. YAB3001]|uniref:aminopeptidase P family protein n=1 Tax=Butyrivibrio sp. YAB3001 TaxID=1520812 RepID=UPI0008F61DF7|nr:aminopeptidase P family protein [Butyrivibrio sp. YAB3001]SFB73409.1 Xaa-Pro aminopeptidase [Butyrivibrio sp. YAB3001]